MYDEIRRNDSAFIKISLILKLFRICIQGKIQTHFRDEYDIILKESKYPERDDGEWSVARLQVW